MESLLKWNRPQNLSLSLQDAVVHHHHGVVALLEVHEGPGEHQAEVPFRTLSPPPLFFFINWAMMTLFWWSVWTDCPLRSSEPMLNMHDCCQNKYYQDNVGIVEPFFKGMSSRGPPPLKRGPPVRNGGPPPKRSAPSGPMGRCEFGEHADLYC